MQLQGDVVSALALAVQQHALGLVALEAQRDHVLQRGRGLLVEPVQQRAPAVEVGHVGLCKDREVTAWDGDRCGAAGPGGRSLLWRRLDGKSRV